jgi:hypothetical protein
MRFTYQATKREVGQWRAVRMVCLRRARRAEGGREGRNSSPASRGTRQLLFIPGEKALSNANRLEQGNFLTSARS